jgi:single-stranded DNA-binding protein
LLRTSPNPWSRGTAVIITGRAAQEERETKDGQKRRSIKVSADKVAPSLRFAACKVARAPQSKPAAGNGHAEADPWAAENAAGYSDEPPF